MSPFRLAVSAEQLDCPRLNVHGTGLDDKGLPPAVASALDRLGYTGVVGLEAWASGDSVQALERFRAAFTVPAARPA